MLERNDIGAKELLKVLEKQEEMLVFDDFTNVDALKLGNIMAELTKDEKPVSMRVFLGENIVFQYTIDPQPEVCYSWTFRKYQLIKKTGHSSMHGKVRMMFLNELQDLKDDETYGFGCGGFPIIVKGKGIVGAAAISGLPDPADHVYVVKALGQMLGVEAPGFDELIDTAWIN